MKSLDLFFQELRENGYEPVGELRISASTWGRLMYNGEKPARASGGYKLIQNSDGSLFANYGSTKDPQGFRSWVPDKARELSYEERVAERTARESLRRYREEQEEKRHRVVGARVARAVARMPEAFDHPYLEDKGILAHGVKIREKKNELIIPRYGADGRIYSIQRIVQRAPGEKSWKGYWRGALGKNLYYPLVLETDEKGVVVLAEGFATGASIRQATGYPVVVCFDTGGLAGVARIFRQRYPKARIVFAADNDQWTFKGNAKPKELDKETVAGDDARWNGWRELGYLQNPGVEKAKQAAGLIGGAIVLTPDFEATHPKKFTDFNDLAREKGEEYVRMLFAAALEIPQDTTPEESVTTSDILSSADPQDPDRSSDVQIAGGNKSRGFMGKKFKVLGYNNGIYYYFPFATRQIVALTAGGHTMANLLQLDTLDSWESQWRDNNGKLMAKHQVIALTSGDIMMTEAGKCGVFIEEAQVCGSGAWIDEGRTVLHCGDTLYVDGEYTRFDEIISEFTYIAAKKLTRPAREPLTSHEAHSLRRICESLTWENKLSGTLLAGWLVIAPICGALGYRPHIYITGEAESGKSTVMDKIVKPVLGKMAMCVDGGTTEPAVRSMMGYDARPLVYDEAEPSPAMSDVIGLARKASTGAIVKKFAQKPFKARFCACFSAINPPVNKTADESRISFMHLKKNLRASALQEYDMVLDQIERTITPDFAERMLARTISNMDTLITNIRVFQRAVRKTIGGSRASQQIGTMLAGVYMLGSTAVIEEEKALEIVSRFSWTDHTIIDQEGDPARLVQWIAGSMIKARGVEETVGELIIKASIEKDQIADKILRSYGIAIKGNKVDIASRSQNLARLLKDTEWGEKWSRTLSDVSGAEKKRIAYFSAGIKTSAISIPIKLFVDREGLEDEATEVDWFPEDEWKPAENDQ